MQSPQRPSIVSDKQVPTQPPAQQSSTRTLAKPLSLNFNRATHKQVPTWPPAQHSHPGWLPPATAANGSIGVGRCTSQVSLSTAPQWTGASRANGHASHQWFAQGCQASCPTSSALPCCLVHFMHRVKVCTHLLLGTQRLQFDLAVSQRLLCGVHLGFLQR